MQAFALGIEVDILFWLFLPKKMGTDSPTRRGKPKKITLILL